MKVLKPALFFFGFAIIALVLINFKAQKAHKSVQDPGWIEQYKAMKGYVDGVNYYGLRNSWNRQDVLNKKSSDALEFITEMGPDNVAGRVRALLIDAANTNRIFAGGISGGLWLSENAGQFWNPVDEHSISMAVSCITQNPFNPLEIYYGTGEGTGNSADLNGGGIYKSVDGGKSFKQLTATATDAAFTTIWDIEYSKTDSSTFYVGTAGGGLIRSTNNGLTFEKVYQSSKAVHEILTYKDSTIWYGLEGYGLISGTEDSIMKFTRFISTLPATNFGRISMSYCTKFPKVAFCQFVNASGTAMVGIYKTSNHGLTWKKMTTPTISGVYSWAWYCLNTSVSPVDTNTVLSISVKGLGSKDGGVTWKELRASHPDYQSSVFYPNGTEVLIGNDGGVYRYNTNTLFTENVSLNNSLNITQFYTGNYNPLNTTMFIGGTQDNGTHTYTGSNFNKALGGDGAYCAFSATPPYYVYASYQNGALRRLNSNFTGETNITPSGAYSWYFINPFVVNPLDGNQIYVLSKTRILASSDAGNNWRELSLPLNKSVLSLGLSYQSDPTVYFGGGGNTLYRCTKANSVNQQEVDLTNTAPTLAKGSTINSIKVSHTNPNTVYISMSDINSKPRVWKLNNAESLTPTWINISGNLPVSLPVNCVEVNPQDSNTIVAGTDFGLYTTSDGGINWSKEMAVPNVPVHKIESHPKNGVIYIFTHGRGVFKSQFENFIPNVSIVKYAIKPKVTFNNPVENNLNLTIDTQNESVDFTLKLYNSAGKMVYGNIVESKSYLDVSHLAKGIYSMHLTTGNDFYYYKILKL